MKARWLAALLLGVVGCIPDHAPKAGRPTGEALAERRGLFLPGRSAGIALPESTAAATGTWEWNDENRPRARRRSAALVLSGGGVRGAFQAGLITRLMTDAEFNEEHRIDHVFGVSVGALNGLLTGLAVSRIESDGVPGRRNGCIDCYSEPESTFVGTDPGPTYALHHLDEWTLWRVWASMAGYRWFQAKRSLVDFVLDGYLFDMRTLRLRLDQFVGDGDTLYLRAPPPRSPEGFDWEASSDEDRRRHEAAGAFQQACVTSQLHWPIMHVGYVPYSTGVYRSVAYDPRREAEAACHEIGASQNDGVYGKDDPAACANGKPCITPPNVDDTTLDWAETRADAVERCEKDALVTGHPLSCATLTWLEASCATPEDGPVSCTRAGSDICCTDDVDAFKDATWASTAQPLLHNPVPIDPTAEGFRPRRDMDAARRAVTGRGGRDRDPVAMRRAQVKTRAKLWDGRVNQRAGMGNHYPTFDARDTQAWQEQASVPNPRKNVYKAVPRAWYMEQGQLEWAVDGGVREVFPLLEALATGVDEIFVIGNVPPQRPECEASFAEELPGPASRTYKIMMRSILEEMVSEIYNDDLLIARQLLQSASLWNREKRGLVSYLRKLNKDLELQARGPAAEHYLEPAPEDLLYELRMLDAGCRVQTVSDARLMEMVRDWLGCDALAEDSPYVDACRRAEDLAVPPRIGLEDWRVYASTMDRLRTVQQRDMWACLGPPPPGEEDWGNPIPGLYRVPDVYVALPDRFPGDPLDQVHQDMVMLMRDGYHRTDRMVPLLDYSPPDRCVEDTICSSCGRGAL